MGPGAIDAMVVAEELGRGIVLETHRAVFHCRCCAVPLRPRRCNVKPGCRAWRSGEALVVLAHQERKARYRLDVCDAKAAPAQSRICGGQLSKAVSGGRQGRCLHRACSSWTGKSPCSWSNARVSGVTTQGYVTQDGSRATEVHLVNAPPCSSPPTAWPRWNWPWTPALPPPAPKPWACDGQTLAITVEYMNQRKQFGVFIASFQALRHRVADMKMQLELARSMSYYASLKLGAAEERRAAMARAKAQLGQSMRFGPAGRNCTAALA